MIMKNILFAFLCLILLAGCTATFEEAYYTDREFGKATRDALEKQIAYPEKIVTAKSPEGVEGIDAEGIMSVHNSSYAEKKKYNVIQFSIGD